MVNESAVRIMLAKERRELIAAKKRNAFEQNLQEKENRLKKKMLENELLHQRFVILVRIW